MTTHQDHQLTRREFLTAAGTTVGGLALAATQLGSLATACDNHLATPLSLKSTLPNTVTTLPTKDFSGIKDRVTGLSWPQLSQHIGLYEGYVRKLNAANQQLLAAQHGQSPSVDLRTLQQKRSYSLNGAVLHDAYFDNLGEDQPTMGPLTQQLINRDFGSQANYLANLAAEGKASRGWVITGWNTLDNRLYNYGLDTHDTGAPLAIHPIVVMDVYEHAYMIDFGTKKASYLDAFANHIRWNIVEERVNGYLAQSHSR